MVNMVGSPTFQLNEQIASLFIHMSLSVYT